MTVSTNTHTGAHVVPAGANPALLAGPDRVGTWLYEATVVAPAFPNAGTAQAPAKTIRNQPITFARQTTLIGGHRYDVVPRDSRDERGIATIYSLRRGGTLEECRSSVLPDLELLIDTFALALHAKPEVGGVRCWDIATVFANPERAVCSAAAGPVFPRDITTATTPSGATSWTVTVPAVVPDSSSETRAALRWYSKSIFASADVDRFVFAWVALEILEKSEPGAKGRSIPYRANCGHLIPNCPDPKCGKPTAKRPGGADMKAFLRSAGVASSVAKQLWGARQMLHGANKLTMEAVLKLPARTLALRKAVSKKLAERVGLGSVIPPGCIELAAVEMILEGTVPPATLAEWRELGFLDG